MSHDHDHDHPHDGAGLDSLDILVICAGLAIAVIAVEWLAGAIIRERISAGAERYLKRFAPAAER